MLFRSAVCPCFESDSEERADAAEGTRQHAALAAMLAGNEIPERLSPGAREAVEWAADHIVTLAGDDAVKSETRLQYRALDAFAQGGRSVVYFGTADALVIRGNLADLIDYKSGVDDRDHRPQLAGYALALFSMRTRIKTVRCHVLYGRIQRVDSWTLTQDAAAGVVMPIIEARNNPERTPNPCEYCSFCGHSATCPALSRQVEVVAKANEWENLAPVLAKPEAITAPETMSKALTLATRVKAWSDAVRKAATNLAREGENLPGYRIQERRGRQMVQDLSSALERTGLTSAQFMTACKLSIPKLADTFAATEGLSKAQARFKVEEMLTDLIVEKPQSISLVADKKGAVRHEHEA